MWYLIVSIPDLCNLTYLDKLYCKFDELAKLECKFDELDKLRISLMSWIIWTVGWMS